MKLDCVTKLRLIIIRFMAFFFFFVFSHLIPKAHISSDCFFICCVCVFFNSICCRDLSTKMILRKFTSDIAAVDFIENCTNSNSIFVSLKIQINFSHPHVVCAVDCHSKKKRRRKNPDGNISLLRNVKDLELCTLKIDAHNFGCSHTFA